MRGTAPLVARATMAGEVTFDHVDGLAKKIYNDTVKNTLPPSSILQRLFPLSSAQRLGDTYEQAVELDPPNGVTYEGSEGDVINLVSPEGMVIKHASLPPCATSLREQSAMAAFSRMQSKGAGAIESYITRMMIAMKASIANRVEASLLIGQSPEGYGVVESVTGVDNSHADVVFTQSTFAPGLFHRFGGRSKWSTWQPGGTARKNVDGDIKLQRVDAKTRTVRFAIAGDIADNFAAGDVLFPFSARTGAANYRETVGLFAQASNTTGTSLGIDAGTFPTWAGNVANVGGTLDWANLEPYFAELRDRGAEDTLLAFVSPRLWADLSSQLQTMRVVDSSYTPSKGKQGFKELAHETHQIGNVKIVEHPFLAQGRALILPQNSVERVGSSDVVFGVPGRQDQMWQYVQDRNAVELRCYTDQAILLSAPSHAYAISGITYS